MKEATNVNTALILYKNNIQRTNLQQRNRRTWNALILYKNNIQQMKELGITEEQKALILYKNNIQQKRKYRPYKMA